MTEGLEIALRSLLAQHPLALLAAIDADGLFVPLPETFDPEGHGVIRARSALELVAPTHHTAVIDAWARAKEAGASTGVAELFDGSAMTMCCFDLRSTYGVFIGVFLIEAEPERLSELSTREPVAPRTGSLLKDEMAVIRWSDHALTAILGWERTELEGTRALELVHPDEQQRAVDSWMEMLATPGRAARWRGRHRRSDGSYVWMEVTNHNHLHDEVGAVVCDMVDVTDEMHAVESLREREQVLTRLAEALPLGVLHVDPDGGILYANDRLHQLLGRGRTDTVADQLSGIIPEDRRVLDAAVRAALADGADGDIEVRVRVPKQPRLHLFAMTFRALVGASGEPAGAVVCVEDITERAELRMEMERRATTDDLTGCLNRSAIIDTVERTLASTASTSGTAVVFLDLDGFKEVNDEHGHRAGDQVLVDTVARLRGAMRAGDSLGRLGGDEFLIVLPNAGSSDDALAVASRMAHAVDGAVMADGAVVHVRASVGVAWTSTPSTEADALIAAADRAMYEAKRAGTLAPVAHLV